MKIITGQYGGRRFDPPRNLPARPTTDMAKQALFNILENRLTIAGCRALDLFSGTGSITMELLSREAAHVVALEVGRQQQQFIRQVADTLRIPRGVFSLVGSDVFDYLARGNHAAPFDFIFADPPYDLDRLATLPDLLCTPTWLAPEALFVLEHGKQHDFSAHPHFQEMRQYGAVHFSFFTLS